MNGISRPAIGAVALIALIASLALAGDTAAETRGPVPSASGRAAFAIASRSVADGARLANLRHVYDKHGCGGANVSPEISWSGAPGGTRSYAVTLFDSDARAGKGWWHWVVVNIPASVTHLAEGASGHLMPDGSVEGTTDFGTPGYQGPCPPPGDGIHHYVLTVHALGETSLPVDREMPVAEAALAIRDHALASASLTFLYGRHTAE